jgi:hypothetical protein
MLMSQLLSLKVTRAPVPALLPVAVSRAREEFGRFEGYGEGEPVAF